jgi:hypothetical protein
MYRRIGNLIPLDYTIDLGQIAGPRQSVDDRLFVTVEAQRDRRAAQQHQEDRGRKTRGGGRFHFLKLLFLIKKTVTRMRKKNTEHRKTFKTLFYGKRVHYYQNNGTTTAVRKLIFFKKKPKLIHVDEHTRFEGKRGDGTLQVQRAGTTGRRRR